MQVLEKLKPRKEIVAVETKTRDRQPPRINFRALQFGPETEGMGLLPPTETMEVHVSVEKSLHLTAVWSAVNYLARSLASLPMAIYKEEAGKGRVENRDTHLYRLLNKAPNEHITAYDWRKLMWDSVFTHGRAYTYIERSPSNKVVALYPLDYNRVTVQVVDGRLVYDYSNYELDHIQKTPSNIRYEANEILDIRFMGKSNMVDHYSPILNNSYVMAVGIAAAKYAVRSFANGGVPQLALTGPFSTGAAISRASSELSGAILKTARQGNGVLPLPLEYKLEKIAITPQELQSNETERWIVEQVSRIYSLPPTMLQDLSNTSFNTSEDMDLQFVKHTLRPWAVQFEQALDMKLLNGRTNKKQIIEHTIDGLLRGDNKSRMEGNARAIQTGQMTPNEARQRENRPPLEGGDDLMVQSGTVPIKKLDELLAKGNKINSSGESGEGENDDSDSKDNTNE